MTEPNSNPDPQNASDDDLRARLDKLETQNNEVLRQAEQRIVLAELKVEAMRAGMIDLDGLTFLDLANLHLEPDGCVSGGVELISRLKQSKPWLFPTPSSSSVAKVPSSKPIHQKLATEMTNDEYKVARANIIKRYSN